MVAESTDTERQEQGSIQTCFGGIPPGIRKSPPPLFDPETYFYDEIQLFEQK